MSGHFQISKLRDFGGEGEERARSDRSCTPRFVLRPPGVFLQEDLCGGMCRGWSYMMISLTVSITSESSSRPGSMTLRIGPRRTPCQGRLEASSARVSRSEMRHPALRDRRIAHYSRRVSRSRRLISRVTSDRKPASHPPASFGTRVRSAWSAAGRSPAASFSIATM